MAPPEYSTPAEYLAALPEQRRSVLERLLAVILEEYPGETPYMRSGMIGIGTYHYKYASGREGDWFIVGLCDRKAGPSVYVCAANRDGYVMENHAHLFPKGSVGRSCLRISKPDEFDVENLRTVLKAAKEAEFAQ